jgi:hypothetical protein
MRYCERNKILGREQEKSDYRWKIVAYSNCGYEIKLVKAKIEDQI